MIKLKDIYPVLGYPQGWFLIYKDGVEIMAVYGDDIWQDYADSEVISVFGVDTANFDLAVEIR